MTTDVPSEQTNAVKKHNAATPVRPALSLTKPKAKAPTLRVATPTPTKSQATSTRQEFRIFFLKRLWLGVKLLFIPVVVFILLATLDQVLLESESIGEFWAFFSELLAFLCICGLFVCGILVLVKVTFPIWAAMCNRIEDTGYFGRGGRLVVICTIIASCFFGAVTARDTSLTSQLLCLVSSILFWLLLLVCFIAPSKKRPDAELKK